MDKIISFAEAASRLAQQDKNQQLEKTGVNEAARFSLGLSREEMAKLETEFADELSQEADFKKELVAMLAIKQTRLTRMLQQAEALNQENYARSDGSQPQYLAKKVIDILTADPLEKLAAMEPHNAVPLFKLQRLQRNLSQLSRLITPMSEVMLDGQMRDTLSEVSDETSTDIAFFSTNWALVKELLAIVKGKNGHLPQLNEDEGTE